MVQGNCGCSMSRGVDGRIVRMHAQVPVLELDHQLDPAVVLAGGEIHERVIVALQLCPHFFERRVGRGSHAIMLA